MLKPLVCALSLGVCAAAAPAEAVSCVTPDVSVAGFGCDAGGLHFGTFTVNPSAGFSAATVGIGAVTDHSLTFQLSTTPGVGPGDIILSYAVTGPISGIGLTNNAIAGPVTIGELACAKVFPLGGTCSPSDRLAALVVGPGESDTAKFTPVSSLFLFKDVNVGVKGFITDFTNAHNVPPPAPVPEPATLMLLGGSAVAGAALWRKRPR